MRTALSHFVFALAQVTHAIALREGILAYGFCLCASPGTRNGEPKPVGEGICSVSDD